MQLTQKETELLKDLKTQEQLCVDKYKQHANCAKDQQLKDLCNQIAGIEQKHLDVITQMESGNVPTQSTNSSGSQTSQSFSATYDVAETPEKQNDSFICNDLLATEKHASHLYDTCVFEFNDENARRALSKIQDEEQEHGKMLYDYMKTNKMSA